jgi:twitching motility protein PilT
MSNQLDELLEKMVELKASDLHLNHNAKISYRVDGDIIQTNIPIDGDTIFGLLIAAKAINSEEQRTYQLKKSIDFSYKTKDLRFRGSLIHQKGKPSCVFRKINEEIISIEELGLPAIIKTLADLQWGMILVTGATGSGKTTTLSSVVDYINKSKSFHIATLEQPLEYLHLNKKSIVTQREVGKDCPTFAEGMKDVLRQDPDVILVGEMRDYDTVAAAVTSAETGHLVLGTLHTNTAPQAISRIVDVYPATQQSQIYSQLANNVKGIINQRLLKNPNGGRTAVFEIMVVNDEIRQLIRQGQIEKIHEAMSRGKADGNLLMSESVAKSKREGTIFSNVEY